MVAEAQVDSPKLFGQIQSSKMLRGLANAFVLLAALVIAALIRKFFFSALEGKIVWVTFYPAVIIVALFGGWILGMLAAGGSCLIALYAWPFFISQPFIKDTGDQLGVFAFLVNCLMISIVAELAKRARNRADAARVQAEQANKAKSVFLANMSHELRTPLNAILGFSRLLQGDCSLSADHRSTIEIVNKSGQHLLGLINNILDMSKIEAGKATVESSSFDARLTLQDVRNMLVLRAESKGLYLELDISPDFPRFIESDEDKLRQCLTNLAINAIKFTPHGGVSLRAGVEPGTDPDWGILVFTVSDTGTGIAPEDQRRIFEPFVQVGRKSDREGSGLGLTITKQFIELLGGRVALMSEVGKGSVFTLRLPVKIAAHPNDGGARPSGFLAALEPGQAVPRILIVEDVSENRLLLQKILSAGGFSVQTAVNGGEGLELCALGLPDLIFMDWRMPVMDGLEATRRIRRLPRGDQVKIVVLSASVFADERESVMREGVDGFLAKPIQFDLLYDLLGKLLGVRLVPMPESPSSVEAVRGDQMSKLVSGALLGALAESIRRLDPEEIAGAIRDIAAVDPLAGRYLDGLAKNYQYTRLLRELNESDHCAEGD